jgi:DNA-binding IclR family transcriptional regulator
LAALVRPIAAAEPLPPWAHLLLSELSADTGETAALAVSSGVMEVFLDVVESTQPVRYSPQIGHRLPLQATASGRALLLQYSREERAALYRKMEFRQYGPTTPVSIDQLEGELRKSAQRGYCLNLGGFTRDLAGVAVGLPLGERRLSIVVAGPINRVEPMVDAIVERLKAGILSTTAP